MAAVGENRGQMSSGASAVTGSEARHDRGTTGYRTGYQEEGSRAGAMGHAATNRTLLASELVGLSLVSPAGLCGRALRPFLALPALLLPALPLVLAVLRAPVVVALRRVTGRGLDYQ